MGSTLSNFKSYQGLKIFKTSQSLAWGCGCGATSTLSEGVEFAPQQNMLFALVADLNHQHKPYRFFWCDSNKLPSLSNNLFLFKDQPQKQSLFSSTTKASSLSYAMVCNFHSFQAANARATITHRARIGGESPTTIKRYRLIEINNNFKWFNKSKVTKLFPSVQALIILGPCLRDAWLRSILNKQ